MCISLYEKVIGEQHFVKNATHVLRRIVFRNCIVKVAQDANHCKQYKEERL